MVLGVEEKAAVRAAAEEEAVALVMEAVKAGAVASPGHRLAPEEGTRAEARAVALTGEEEMAVEWTEEEGWVDMKEATRVEGWEAGVWAGAERVLGYAEAEATAEVAVVVVRDRAVAWVEAVAIVVNWKALSVGSAEAATAEDGMEVVESEVEAVAEAAA